MPALQTRILSTAVVLLLALGGCQRQSEPPPEAQSEPQTEAQSEPQTEAQSEPQTEAQPEAAAPGGEAGCRVEPPSEPVACTMEWNPVCGCDGRTYGNACQARAAGLSRHTPGECDPSRLTR